LSKRQQFLRKSTIFTFLSMAFFAALLGAGRFAAVNLGEPQAAEAAVKQSALGSGTLFMPYLADNSAPLLCRFGVNVSGNLASTDLAPLRSGWYVDYQALANPLRPGGAEYMPIIDLSQLGVSGYEYEPNGAVLEAVVANNPGAGWLIGNEPDRQQFQNDMEPEVYADAYHELYYLIKGLDPTARIIAGTIVQPTDIRLDYLDLVLSAYQADYGESMPVDGWSAHNFILNEVNEERCSPEELPAWVWEVGCWGAGVPPGEEFENVLFGEVVPIDENDSMDYFRERVVRFRQWMKDNGYRNVPLLISEYGILMPQDFGFPSWRVNQFMNSTFTYMLNTTDPNLGLPQDENRLVQQFSWYSTTDNGFNGWLFNPQSFGLTDMGWNYRQYTSLIAEKIDLFPMDLTMQVNGPNVTLAARIANSGNLAMKTAADVVFYDGNPSSGGQQIGSVQFLSVRGCGNSGTVSINWPNPSAGSHNVYVRVKNAGFRDETNAGNNQMMKTFVVPSR